MSFREYTASILLCATFGFAAEPGMVFVPAGEFVRGRAHEHPDSKLPYYPNPLRDDLPVKTIYVDAFYLDETEVTNARYAAFMKATKHPAPYHWRKGEMPTGKENVPIINVSWDDAVACCAWEGKRLPTEAEWERACRGLVQRQMHPWGDRDPPIKDAHFGRHDR
jgi:formylglycine-generating enzyme required for sulfatase activity